MYFFYLYNLKFSLGIFFSLICVIRSLLHQISGSTFIFLKTHPKICVAQKRRDSLVSHISDTLFDQKSPALWVLVVDGGDIILLVHIGISWILDLIGLGTDSVKTHTFFRSGCIGPPKSQFGSNIFWKHQFALFKHKILLKTNRIISSITKSLRNLFNADLKMLYSEKSHSLTISPNFV